MATRVIHVASMASKTSSKPNKGITSHPGTLRYTGSLTRLDEQDKSRQRPQRTASFQPTSAGPLGLGDDDPLSPDAFETTSADDEPAEHPRASVDLDELPIEVISMTDNFIDSLSARVNPTPPNIDNLSHRFQDFYAQASDRIKTHLRSLGPRQQRRDVSPAPSNSSVISAASLFRAKAVSLGTRDKPKEPVKPAVTVTEHQMLTSDELADRKKQRKATAAKKGLLEEAVERRLCEGIYDKIYRHRTTQDEAQDAKLRSKTAALDVVGIGPLELGVDLGDITPEAGAKQAQEVRERLEGARKQLILVHQKRYPLAKLHHLKTVHKEIVDTLSFFHPSSSADEIMPMLIFTLITLSPENLNVISDLHFIQRFRWEQKLAGEAAYCLTNLEAAIAFLDTVDLAALRSDESPSGPPKSPTDPSTPKTETFPPAYTGHGIKVKESEPSSPEATLGATSAAKPLPSPTGIRATVQLRNRRLSDLVQTPAQALGAASDTIFNTADHGIKTISTSLGDSYKFFMGKLGGAPATVGGTRTGVVVPQTLEDARKLIGTPPPEGDDDGSGSDDMSVTDGGAGNGRGTRARVEDRVLALVGGRKGGMAMRREDSVDSVRSVGTSGSVRKLSAQQHEAASATSAAAATTISGAGGASTPGTGAPTSNPAIVESMRNLGSSLNPVARIGAGMNMIRGFGRAASTPAVSTGATTTGTTRSHTVAAVPEVEAEVGHGTDAGDLATAFPDLAPALPPKETPKVAPPIQRFLEIEDPGELKLREALELLRDYRRLAGVLQDMDAFETTT